MPGRERDRLISQYQAAVQAYSEAVRRLVGLAGNEFENAYKEAERLRKLSEQHRVELEMSDR